MGEDIKLKIQKQGSLPEDPEIVLPPKKKDLTTSTDSVPEASSIDDALVPTVPTLRDLFDDCVGLCKEVSFLYGATSLHKLVNA